MTVNSIKFKELGRAINEEIIKVEKARMVWKEAGIEFDEETFIGTQVLLNLRRKGECNV